MPSKFTSPYAPSFTTAVKNGTPCSVVVWNIAKRTNKPVNTVWNSLYKAGLCFRQKFNGTWLYWPSFPVKKTAAASNATQCSMWQSFVDWCVVSGYCTPNQLSNNASTQKNFMNYCRNYFGKQFTGKPVSKRVSKRRPTPKTSRKTTSSYKPNWNAKPTTKRTTRKNRKTTTSTPWSRTSTSARNYKFPTMKNRPATRRYVRAA